MEVAMQMVHQISNLTVNTQTPKCTKHEQETLKQPHLATSFSHASTCKGLPATQSYETWCSSAEHDGKQGTPSVASTSQEARASSSSLSAQHDLMQKFSQRGLENPAKQVTLKGFQQHLVM
ncbi:hypothetical protein PAXRUDRAFT_22445 [Paxillus rubicundulus Ve08.2h10]|uniref:Uncharacterized protein n=1 Tax=Paxillus rubicundulus Ve08.2h10 TaxID=930991 RepID=A0A0D0CXH0_9AGAM|nr:hypothetical protein PAXRUDRAFT_22445 [Paxillus rubicundulus Ve08.2h10]